MGRNCLFGELPDGGIEEIFVFTELSERACVGMSQEMHTSGIGVYRAAAYSSKSKGRRLMGVCLLGSVLLCS
jgi:hypothetical protein